MMIRVENARSKVVDATPDEFMWLHHYLTFEDEKAKYIARYSRWSKGDGKIRLFDRRNHTIPSGMLSMVVAAGRRLEDPIHVSLDDCRVPPCAIDPEADLKWLRDYQLAAVREVIANGRGILKMPTAAGKTSTAFGVIRSFPATHWLFLVHRAGIARQTAARWQELGGDPTGFIGDGEWKPDPLESFTCATFQGIARKLKSKNEEERRIARSFMGSVGGIICDEAHTVAAESFNAVAMEARNAYWRVGLSATPLARGDRRSTYTVAALGPIIYELDTQVLVDRGVIARPTIRMVTCMQKMQTRDWQEAYRELVAGSSIRNALVVDMAKSCEKPALLFVQNIAHGKALLDYLHREGIAAEFCWGQKKSPERDRAAKRLIDGDIDVLVCSAILTEGIDLPPLRSVVNGAGRRTKIGALQRIGRGMRIDKASGKTTFEVWDVADRGNHFMERHARERAAAYRKEGHEVLEIEMSDVFQHVGTL